MREIITGTAFFLHCLFSIALYGAAAISLFTIARKNHVPHGWLAFVPVFQFYIIGSLCEEYILAGHRIRHLEWIMILLELLQIYLGFFSGFFFLPVRLVVNVLTALILHKFYYLFVPSRATIYAVLSLLGRLPLVLLLFALKDKPMVMSAGAYPYPFANRY